MWKLNRYPFDFANVYAWSSWVKRIAAVRVVPAALPHLPAFSGMTWLKYCANSGWVYSFAAPRNLSLPRSGNPVWACADAAPTSAATAMASVTLLLNIPLPPPCLRRGRRERERDVRAVGARPQRLVGPDRLLERDRERVIGDRAAPTGLRRRDRDGLGQAERPVGQAGCRCGQRGVTGRRGDGRRRGGGVVLRDPRREGPEGRRRAQGEGERGRHAAADRGVHRCTGLQDGGRLTLLRGGQIVVPQELGLDRL